jgi:hypothetical protein
VDDSIFRQRLRLKIIRKRGGVRMKIFAEGMFARDGFQICGNKPMSVNCTFKTPAEDQALDQVVIVKMPADVSRLCAGFCQQTRIAVRAMGESGLG